MWKQLKVIQIKPFSSARIFILCQVHKLKSQMPLNTSMLDTYGYEFELLNDPGLTKSHYVFIIMVNKFAVDLRTKDFQTTESRFCSRIFKGCPNTLSKNLHQTFLSSTRLLKECLWSMHAFWKNKYFVTTLNSHTLARFHSLMATPTTYLTS